jgi:hypothetical protein
MPKHSYEDGEIQRGLQMRRLVRFSSAAAGQIGQGVRNLIPFIYRLRYARASKTRNEAGMKPVVEFQHEDKLAPYTCKPANQSWPASGPAYRNATSVAEPTA